MSMLTTDIVRRFETRFARADNVQVQPAVRSAKT